MNLNRYYLYDEVTACLNEFVEGGHPQCAVNPRTAFEEEYPREIQKADVPKKVAVIGGGNVAMDVARAAVRLGAEVTVWYRRTEEEMPADRDEAAEAKEEGVRFRYLAAPAEITEEDGTLCLRMEKMTPGAPDAGGRRSVKGTGE